MTAWCRLYSDMPTDPKWRVVARRAGRPVSEVISVFVHMMANLTERGANASERRAHAAERGGKACERDELLGWDDEDVAIALDLDTEHVAAIRAAMQGKTLDGERLTGWERRQPLREDGARERAQAWREEQKRLKAEKENVSTDKRSPAFADSDNTDRTQSNASERKRTPEAEAEAKADSDTEAEARQARVASEAAREPAAAAKPDLIDFEAQCRHLLAGFEPPTGAFGAMHALIAAGHTVDHAVAALRAEVARDRKPVGSWKLWAKIVAERLGPSARIAASAPVTVWTGSKVQTKQFGRLSSDFLVSESRNGRWKRGYGEDLGKPGCVVDMAQVRMVAGRFWHLEEIARAVAQHAVDGSWPRDLGPPLGSPDCAIRPDVASEEAA